MEFMQETGEHKLPPSVTDTAEKSPGWSKMDEHRQIKEEETERCAHN